MITSFLLTLILCAVLACVFKIQYKVWLLRSIPGPKGLPLIGHTLDFRMQTMVDSLPKYAAYGGVVKLYFGPIPVCLITNANAAKTILSSPKLIEKTDNYDLLRDVFGDSVVISSGSKWQSRRKMLIPAFHAKVLEGFLDIFNSQSNTLTRKLRAKADGKPFDVSKFITDCVLDTLYETAMGQKANIQEGEVCEYTSALTEVAQLNFKRLCTPWLRPKWLFRVFEDGQKYDACQEVVQKVSLEAIRARREARKAAKEYNGGENDTVGKGLKKRLSFLDLLLKNFEEGENISEKDVQDEVATIMVAGHDTSSTAVNWVLFLLGHNPEMQTRVSDELDSIFEHSDHPATADDLRSMKVLEACIKESLRLYPPGPRFSRNLSEDISIGDYVIPAETNVFIIPYAIHRDPEYFPDPEKFDPDRFLLGNAANLHPYAFIPFSAGPRNCLGNRFAMMQMLVLLSSILKRFRIESVVPREEIVFQNQFVLKPEGGTILKLYGRT